MLIVGLTGGIGSGKSVVATLFAERGVPIIDTDKIARELTQPGEPALARIIKHFGEHLLLTDGSLDRPALRDIVFSHTQQRLWLEALLHPLILKETELQVKKNSAIYCIVVVPLLLEVECYSFINRILVVDTSQESQIKRIETRDHMSLPQIQAILHTQARRSDRLAHAHDIIVNEGSLADLVPQVDVLHQMYLHLGEQKLTSILSS